MLKHFQTLALGIIGCLFIYGCKKQTTEVSPQNKPNILFIIADDMGLDATLGFTIGNLKPTMPHLQSLMQEGLTFENFSAYPVCSPTRASIITGKHGLRNGVLQVGDDLSATETGLQEYIDMNTNSAYATALIGKWHLGNDLNQPITMGADYFAGFSGGGVGDYSNWTLVENGQSSTSQDYITSKLSDLAIDWIDEQDKPWFLWLAYNAAHTPFHLPPNNLHSQGALPTDQASIDANPLPYYLAMLEAMDHEMGRVIESISQEERENTIVIFIGDNGTPNQVVQEYASQRAKGTIYQGGIATPLVVSGKLVTKKGREEAIVNSTDLFATIAGIAGVDVEQIHDSKNFGHLFYTGTGIARTYGYSEKGTNTGSDYMLRDATHKYIHFEDGTEALFNIENTFIEKPNLLNPNQLPLSAEDDAQLQRLKTQAAIIR